MWAEKLIQQGPCFQHIIPYLLLSFSVHNPLIKYDLVQKLRSLLWKSVDTALDTWATRYKPKILERGLNVKSLGLQFHINIILRSLTVTQEWARIFPVLGLRNPLVSPSCSKPALHPSTLGTFFSYHGCSSLGSSLLSFQGIVPAGLWEHTLFILVASPLPLCWDRLGSPRASGSGPERGPGLLSGPERGPRLFLGRII